MTVKSRIAKQAVRSGEARTKRRTLSKAAPKAVRAPRKRQRKFYVIEPAWAGDFPYDHLNYEAFNGADLFARPKEARGFDRYAEPPTFLFTGKTERDFWQYTFYWFISDRMKAFLERFDPAAFEFLKCDIKLPDGTSGPVRWLCDAVRILDAVDEEKSTDIFIEADTAGRKYYLIGSGSFAFNEDVVGPHHVFHMMHSNKYVVGDEGFKRACKEAGIKGISFRGGRPKY